MSLEIRLPLAGAAVSSVPPSAAKDIGSALAARMGAQTLSALACRGRDASARLNDPVAGLRQSDPGPGGAQAAALLGGLRAQ